MNARIRRKYMYYYRCVHQKDNIYYDVASFCGAQNKDCECDWYCRCKEYKHVKVSVPRKRYIKYFFNNFLGGK